MRVLLAVDGSEQSQHAASVLTHLRPLDELIVLHAVDVPQMAYPIGRPEMGPAVPVQVETALREAGERLLARTVSELPSGARSVEDRLETGRPADAILEVAEKEMVDLIVLGARGLSGIQEFLLGSVSQQVLQHAHCPVLVVRRPMPRLRRVLVPLQGPDDGDAALHFLVKSPFRGRPEVTVVHALPFHEPLWPGGLEAAEAHRAQATAAARELVGGVVQTLLEYKYPATSRVLIGQPAAVILDQLEETEADLVLMGSRGRHGVKRILLGSVSHALVHRSPVPVLVLR